MPIGYGTHALTWRLQVLTGLSLIDLLDSTDWERRKWYDWLRQCGQQVLEISAGHHGDGSFQSVGGLVKHIFTAEKQYDERLSGRPLTDPASTPTAILEGL